MQDSYYGRKIFKSTDIYTTVAQLEEQLAELTERNIRDLQEDHTRTPCIEIS